MAEVRQEFKFEDSGMIEGLRAMRDLAVSIEKGFADAADESGNFSKEVQEDMANSRKALDKVIEGIDKKAKSTKADEKATAEWKKGIRDAANEVEILGVNVGGLVDKLKAKQASLAAVVKGLGATGKSAKALGTIVRTTLISTGIGALVVVLGSLVAWLTKTQTGMDKVKVVTAQVGSVFANVTERAVKLWEGIRVFASGEFRKGLQQMVDSFRGMGKEIASDVKATGELTKSQLALSKAIDLVETQRAKDLARVKDLNQIAEDTTKSDQERAEAAQKAMSIERASLNTLISLKQQQLDNLKAEHALSITTQEDIRKEQELEREIAELRASSTEQQTTLQNKLNTINDQRNALMEQERANALALRDAYLDLVGQIEQRIEQENLASLSGIERIEEERRIATEQVKLLEAQAKAAALAAGATYDLDESFRTLYRNIERGYEDAVKDLTAGRENDRVIEALLPTKGVASNAERLIKNYKTALNLAIAEESGNALDNIRDGIMDWLGLDEQGMQELVGTVAGAFDQLGAMYTSSINRQLDENGRLLDSLAERESIIQQGLERELRLQEEGRANNVEGKRKELEAIRKEEEKAEKEAAKLRRRQQAAQLAANLAQQGSNLVTAVSEIFAANAGIPLVGIINAGVAIASMFASFASAKSQAQSAVGRRAYKGGALEDYLGRKRTSGFVKRGGQSDIPGRGNGYRVMGTDLVFGGDEFMMNENESRANAKFLTAMNAGKFRGIDLNAFASNASLDEMKKFNRMTSIRRASIEKGDRMRWDSVLTDAVNRGFNSLIGLQKRRKDRMALADFEAGYVEFDDLGNKKIIRK